MAEQTLIVLGAGPKAVALCAKAAALAAVGFQPPKIVVVERSHVAAHWSGSTGYTDGFQPLGTPPEKDVGYPYSSACWGSKDQQVNRAMLQWSWPTYLVSEGKYSEWIDRGRSAPRHRDFCRYLSWVAEKVSMASQLTIAEAIQIEIVDGQWGIICKRTESGRHVRILGDGLLITGPGEPLRIAGEPDSHPRVLDGKSFWRTLSQPTIKPESSVAVIGAGETAASIAVALHSAFGNCSATTIINPYGVLYSRGESYTENRQFSDPADWKDLSLDHRRELIRRTDRGVFSAQAQATLNKAPDVRLLQGKVVDISYNDHLVRLKVEYGDSTAWHSYDYVVVATGFFPLSFARLMEGQAVVKFSELLGLTNWSDFLSNELTQKDTILKIENMIADDLSVGDLKPRLHLPMLAGVAQGPGFPNLSCLGLIADRVLRSYVPNQSQDRLPEDGMEFAAQELQDHTP